MKQAYQPPVISVSVPVRQEIVRTSPGNHKPIELPPVPL